MSMRCEDIRPLLAELVYEEVDPGVAEQVREHLGTCLSCRRRQMAFEAVRQDLQQWQPAETPSPAHGITFIAPARHAATPIWHSRAFQGLAAAAGFMFVAVLLAAAVNFQVQGGPDGWALSTSFGQSQAFEAPAIALEQISGLDDWFNTRFSTRMDSQLGNLLADHGVVTLASMPRQQFFTDGQVQELNRRMTAVLDQTIAERDAERDTRLETELADLRYYVDSSVEQQANIFFYSVANMVEGIEAEHRDELFQLTQQYSNLYANQDRKLQEAFFRIDNLAMAAPTRSPEQ